MMGVVVVVVVVVCEFQSFFLKNRKRIIYVEYIHNNSRLQHVTFRKYLNDNKT